MKHLWRALFVVLVLGAFMPSRSAAQGSSPQTGGGQGAGLRLDQNYPNPVTQDTRIQFVIGDAQGCTDSGRQHRVSLRIYNLLAQQVGVPGWRVLCGIPVATLSALTAFTYLPANDQSRSPYSKSNRSAERSSRPRATCGKPARL